MKYLFDYRVWGSLLGATLFVLVLGVISDALVQPKPMTKPGYALPTAKAEKHVAKKAAAPAVPLPELLAKGSESKGKRLAAVCGACHNFAKGAGTKVGPDLWGVVGRPKGSEPGFAYSSAMKAKGGDWTYADIFTFIKKPKAYVPGTKMGFGGEPNPQKRADILLFLRTLSDHPVPLPKAAAAPQKAAAAAPAAAPAPAAKPAAAKPAASANSLPALLAKANPAKGKQFAAVCSACHNFAKGAGPKVGPDLWGVVGRPKGKQPGFAYSSAMKAKGGDWTYADIFQFIKKPQAYVPGTKMGFGGQPDPQKRADIIAFLRTLSDHPVPLPPAK